ncbi:hypothetical protein [uncultured Mucilaginibacter sp.]|uniref:hypothetical protein n=1 Tax=uncultured Mucilaginibacter sp. TaxID=797541 RepID=UPI0025DD5DA7|nr:hypothetical protein [uncultured Mucilaginibacter sp.]
MKKAYEQQVKKILLAAFVILNVSYLLVNKLLFGIMIKPDQAPSWLMWASFYTVMALLGWFTYIWFIRAEKNTKPAQQESQSQA